MKTRQKSYKICIFEDVYSGVFVKSKNDIKMTKKQTSENTSLPDFWIGPTLTAFLAKIKEK